MTDLKKQNEPKLIVQLLIAMVPVYLSIFALHGEMLFELAEKKSLVSILQLTVIGLSPLACLKIILALLSGQMSRNFKERLVHLRWRNPLPGCRANILLLNDPRIEVDCLPAAVANLMDKSLNPRERNARWYKNIYVPVRDMPVVSNTHRQYLLHRDSASGVFVVLIIIGLADLVGRLAYDFPIMTPIAYLVHSAYMLLLIGVARQEGNRMVTGAIANFISTQSSGGAR